MSWQKFINFLSFLIVARSNFVSPNLLYASDNWLDGLSPVKLLCRNEWTLDVGVLTLLYLYFPCSHFCLPICLPHFMALSQINSHNLTIQQIFPPLLIFTLVFLKFLIYHFVFYFFLPLLPTFLFPVYFHLLLTFCFFLYFYSFCLVPGDCFA